MNNKLASACVSLALVAGAAGAQDKPERVRRTPTPLRLQVVFSRFQGEKKVSSVPYTISVNSDDRPSQLRMGIQVPIQIQPKDGPPTISYKDVGNNLDCSAEAMDDGRFKLMCSFEQSSLYAADAERRGSGSATGEIALGNNPLIRNFRSSTSFILRDGQSGLHTAAADPVSGEVVKIEVTLNVLK